MLVLGACSSSDGLAAKSPAPDQSAGGAISAEVSCTADPRVSAFEPGASATGPNSVSVTLESGEPAPPAIGDNTWIVVVAGAEGEPLVGATLALAAKMPDHGHSSPKTPLASVTDEQGRATITDLDLFMAGVWRIDFEITAAGETTTTDSVSLAFCVEG